MLAKSMGALASCLFAFLFLIGTAQPARAGGFGLMIEVPAASIVGANDASVLIVKVHSYYGGALPISAKAEGLVGGRRVSIPIKLDALPGSGGAYTIRRQWPMEGTWIVSLSVTSVRTLGDPKKPFRLRDNALVKFSQDGSVQNVRTIQASGDGEARQVVYALHVSSKDKHKKVNAVLETLAKERSVVATR